MIAVIGANGQLGTELCKQIPDGECVPLEHADIAVEQRGSVFGQLMHQHPLTAIVNCAAFHNVERCEAEPPRAWAVNATGARNVAEIAVERQVPVVYVSTDYVFNGMGERTYVESDAPNPLQVYGRTKLAGELATLSIAPQGIVARVSALFGTAGCRAKGGGNFVKTMLRLGREHGRVEVTDTQVVSPTYAPDAAERILGLLGTGARGIFHATSGCPVTWWRFAQMIFESAEMDVAVQRRVDEKPDPLRPRWSALRSYHAPSLDWLGDAIQRYLAEVPQ